MDTSGTAVTAVSLTAPGNEAVFDPVQVADLSRKVNDQFYNSKAAAKEAKRCIKELDCVGIFINSYSTVGNPADNEVAELDVPVYLHPRIVANGQMRIWRGYEFLAGSPWGFNYALRLKLSGLFDRYLNLRLVPSHCGEGLPTAIDRADHRMRHFKPGEADALQRVLTYYFAKNLWLTTARVVKVVRSVRWVMYSTN
ncbi:hypothetical protein MMC11_007162 [Xylographa trunciseda]|nr:hypothetical protein [Xylographa trunciseda]